MATDSAVASAPSWRQMALINDLIESIELDHSSIDARKLLVEQYQNLGWDDAAADVAEAVLQLDPHDTDIKALLVKCGRIPAENERPSPYQLPPKPVAGGNMTLKQLRHEYESLQVEARNLLREMLVFRELAPNADCSQQIADLTELSEGRVFSVARRKVSNSATSLRKPPCSARTLATKMRSDPSKALDVAITDFEGAVRYTGETGTQRNDTDALRDTLRKRVDVVKSALPADMTHIASDAFMHIEHEVFQRRYVNDESMLGDPIADIPRDMFWASEDGYAWDISELVEAVKANKGAMRNPLSRENFSVADIEAIVRHPAGKQLAAIQLEQNNLFKGVRQETITSLRDMAKVLLEDDTENSHPSHAAVDEFLSYMATLPMDERKAIDKLRVPAVDSHTGQQFDDTIGDAVRDAKGNRVCFHKAGDLLRQAADFLSKGDST